MVVEKGRKKTATASRAKTKKKPERRRKKKSEHSNNWAQSCDSPLIHADLRKIMTFEVFDNLVPPEEKDELMKLLPGVDTLSVDSLRRMFKFNPFFRAALHEYQEGLSSGAFDEDADFYVYRKKQKARKLPEWKVKHFEQFYGEKKEVVPDPLLTRPPQFSFVELEKDVPRDYVNTAPFLEQRRLLLEEEAAKKRRPKAPARARVRAKPREKPAEKPAEIEVEKVVVNLECPHCQKKSRNERAAISHANNCRAIPPLLLPVPVPVAVEEEEVAVVVIVPEAPAVVPLDVVVVEAVATNGEEEDKKE